MEFALTKDGLTVSEVRSFDTVPDDPTGKGWKWLPYVRVAAPAYDPSTQDIIGPDHDVTVTEIAQTWQVVNVDAATATQRQNDTDLVTLREAGKDITLVLVELIEWTLDNTAMQPTDFSADVKQAFLDLQVIADRLRAP